jgi:hypothetical protein
MSWQQVSYALVEEQQQNFSRIFFLGLPLATMLISLWKDFLLKPELEVPLALSAQFFKV